MPKVAFYETLYFKKVLSCTLRIKYLTNHTKIKKPFTEDLPRCPLHGVATNANKVDTDKVHISWFTYMTITPPLYAIT